jgi:hypothetical protein
MHDTADKAAVGLAFSSAGSGSGHGYDFAKWQLNSLRVEHHADLGAVLHGGTEQLSDLDETFSDALIRSQNGGVVEQGDVHDVILVELEDESLIIHHHLTGREVVVLLGDGLDGGDLVIISSDGDVWLELVACQVLVWEAIQNQILDETLQTEDAWSNYTAST